MQKVVLIITGMIGVQTPPDVQVVYNNNATGTPIEQSEAIDLEVLDPRDNQRKKLSDLQRELKGK